jgi:hypothetical protein
MRTTLFKCQCYCRHSAEHLPAGAAATDELCLMAHTTDVEKTDEMPAGAILGTQQ